MLSVDDRYALIAPEEKGTRSRSSGHACVWLAYHLVHRPVEFRSDDLFFPSFLLQLCITFVWRRMCVSSSTWEKPCMTASAGVCLLSLTKKVVACPSA